MSLKDSWQTTLYKKLRNREWYKVGDLFEAVEGEIPLQRATRWYMSRFQVDDLPLASEAKWKFFKNDLAKLGVERESGRNTEWNSRVRIAYVKGKTCLECNGPVIRATWSSGRITVCLACEANPVVKEEILPPLTTAGEDSVDPVKLAALVNAFFDEFTPKPTPEPVTEPLPKAPRAGAAKRRRPKKVYPIPEPKPLPVPEPLPVPQPVLVDVPVVDRQPRLVKRDQVKKPIRRDPLEEAWLHLLTHLENSDRDNRKLRRAMRLAFEMGIINEYQQITKLGMNEFRQIGYPAIKADVLEFRAIKWMNLELGSGNKILPEDVKRKRKWTPKMVGSYMAASIEVIKLGADDDQLLQIADTYAELYEKRCVTKTPPQPKPPLVQRFVTATKKAVRYGMMKWR